MADVASTFDTAISNNLPRVLNPKGVSMELHDHVTLGGKRLPVALLAGRGLEREFRDLLTGEL